MGLGRAADILADRAVHHFVHLRGIAEDERQANDQRLRHQIVQRRGVHPGDVDDAEAGLLQRILFIAQLAGMKHLNPDTAARAFLDQLAHELHAFDGRVAIGVDVGGAERDALGLGAATDPGGSEGGAEHEATAEGITGHGPSPCCAVCAA